jgi:hypothetical protein
MEIPALPMYVHAIYIGAKTAISKFILFILDSFICRKLHVLTEVEWSIVTTGRFELDSIYTRGYLIFRSCICRLILLHCYSYKIYFFIVNIHNIMWFWNFTSVSQ